MLAALKAGAAPWRVGEGGGGERGHRSRGAGPGWAALEHTQASPGHRPHTLRPWIGSSAWVCVGTPFAEEQSWEAVQRHARRR